MDSNEKSIIFLETDFELWKVKMQVILTQEKYVDALKGKALMHAPLTQVEKNEMMNKDNNVIIWYLEDKFYSESLERRL